MICKAFNDQFQHWKIETVRVGLDNKRVLRCNNSRYTSVTSFHSAHKNEHCVKNATVSPSSLVWKFCFKAQFPESFGRFETIRKLCLSTKFPH